MPRGNGASDAAIAIDQPRSERDTRAAIAVVRQVSFSNWACFDPAGEVVAGAAATSLIRYALETTTDEAGRLQRAFLWFIGLSMDAAVWDVKVFTKNCDRLLEDNFARGRLLAVLADPAVKP